VVRLDGQPVKIRLIGVDAPESVDPQEQKRCQETLLGPEKVPGNIIEKMLKRFLAPLPPFIRGRMRDGSGQESAAHGLVVTHPAM
jgi:hypothetical protein